MTRSNGNPQHYRRDPASVGDPAGRQALSLPVWLAL